MKLFLETVTETQKNSLDAAAGFADTCLVVAERLTQLNIEVTRTTFEKSWEIALHCLEGGFGKGNASGLNACVQSVIE